MATKFDCISVRSKTHVHQQCFLHQLHNTHRDFKKDFPIYVTLHAHYVVVVIKDWHLVVPATMEGKVWLAIQDRSTRKTCLASSKKSTKYYKLTSCKTF